MLKQLLLVTHPEESSQLMWLQSQRLNSAPADKSYQSAPTCQIKLYILPFHGIHALRAVLLDLSVLQAQFAGCFIELETRRRDPLRHFARLVQAPEGEARLDSLFRVVSRRWHRSAIELDVAKLDVAWTSRVPSCHTKGPSI